MYFVDPKKLCWQKINPPSNLMCQTVSCAEPTVEWLIVFLSFYCVYYEGSSLSESWRKLVKLIVQANRPLVGHCDRYVCKGKAHLYSTFNETSPQGAQVCITQGCPCKLHHTCLYPANVRQMAPPEWQTSNSSLWLYYDSLLMVL